MGAAEVRDGSDKQWHCVRKVETFCRNRNNGIKSGDRAEVDAVESHLDDRSQNNSHNRDLMFCFYLTDE